MGHTFPGLPAQLTETTDSVLLRLGLRDLKTLTEITLKQQKFPIKFLRLLRSPGSEPDGAIRRFFHQSAGGKDFQHFGHACSGNLKTMSNLHRSDRVILGQTINGQ